MDMAMIALVVLALCGAGAGALMVPATLAFAEKAGPGKRRRLWLPAASVLIGAGAGWWGMAFDHSLLTVILTAVLGWQLLLIAVVDAENHWLPDILTFPLGITGLVASIVLPAPFGHGWMVALATGAIAFAALWSLGFLHRKLRGRDGLGGGDPILLGMGAVWVGPSDVVPVLFLASVVTVLTAGVLKLAGREIGGQSELPFGTGMAAGFAIMWLVA